MVFPMAAPPLEDGAVLVSGDRLVAVGHWRELRAQASGPVVDLGDVALLPGLINAHCHLDYTHFAGHIGPPRSFSAWIQGVLALKAGWSYSEYAASWLDGARQLVRSGCTTVVDIEAVPELLPDAWDGTPLRVISALEMTGVRSQRSAAEILGETLARVEGLAHPRCRAALSPHAPYSTRPELLTLSAQAARDRGLLVTAHVAESEEEFDMFRHGKGAMHQWLKSQRGAEDCGLRTPLAHVDECGLLSPGALVVHANYLETADVERLARSGAHVVHCPQSHDYFSHAPFPMESLRKAGVNVCLGTDSLISVRRVGRAELSLDLFNELRLFRRKQPGWSPLDLLSLVTTAAAQAVGRVGEVGILHPGALADLMAVPISGRVEEAAEEVLAHRGPVLASMIGGQWALVPAGVPGVGVEIA
jgi:cytosine/adenosine deaminase-related metal-dependent hydrolase